MELVWNQISIQIQVEWTRIRPNMYPDPAEYAPESGRICTRIRPNMYPDPDGMDCQKEFTFRYIPRSSLSVSKGVSFTLCSMKKLSTEKSGFKKSCLEIQRPDGQFGTIDSILSILSILIAEKKTIVEENNQKFTKFDEN